MVDLYGNLVGMLVAHLDMSADRIQPTDTFHSLGMDSLDVIELWFAIEERWGIDKDMLDRGSHQTLGELARQVERQAKKLGILDKPIFGQ